MTPADEKSAVRRFLKWCEQQGIELVQLDPYEYVHPFVALERWLAGYDRYADWQTTSRAFDA